MELADVEKLKELITKVCFAENKNDVNLKEDEFVALALSLLSRLSIFESHKNVLHRSIKRKEVQPVLRLGKYFRDRLKIAIQSSTKHAEMALHSLFRHFVKLNKGERGPRNLSVVAFNI